TARGGSRSWSWAWRRLAAGRCSDRWWPTRTGAGASGWRGSARAPPSRRIRSDVRTRGNGAVGAAGAVAARLQDGALHALAGLLVIRRAVALVDRRPRGLLALDLGAVRGR